jgi:hypothetical protein
MAPNRKAVTQYRLLRGNLLSMSVYSIPQAPPQNARENTAGTPNGWVLAMEKGPKGAKPISRRIARSSLSY